jgi:hypothetical protein
MLPVEHEGCSKCHGLVVGTHASYLLGPGDKVFWFRAGNPGRVFHGFPW